MASASELEKGNYFLFNGEPVRVTRKEIVTVGTHCHTKLKIFFQGLVSKGEKTQNFSHGDKVEVLDIMRKSGQVIAASPKLQIMDMVTYETLDAEPNPEMQDVLKEGDYVTFIEYRGKTQILELR